MGCLKPLKSYHRKYCSKALGSIGIKLTQKSIDRNGRKVSIVNVFFSLFSFENIKSDILVRNNLLFPQQNPIQTTRKKGTKAGRRNTTLTLFAGKCDRLEKLCLHEQEWMIARRAVCPPLCVRHWMDFLIFSNRMRSSVYLFISR